MKKLDWYIIKKFLGTYFFTIALILSITIVIDYNSKMEKFSNNEAPSWEVFKYYLNFIPYFANLFSPLFVFVACIFFTSKIAGDSEIIAMFASGVSFMRLLRPYLISAALLGTLTFLLNSFVIPVTSVDRIEFLNTYYKDRKITSANNNQFMVKPGVVFYLYRFDTKTNSGLHFALERYEDKKLVSRLTANKAIYKGDYHWELDRWNTIDINPDGETLNSGLKMDTIVTIAPEDIIFQRNDFEKMTTPELKTYIDKQRTRGTGNIQEFEIEYHKRFAAIATSFILTLIAVCLSSKKIRGGMGINLGIGLVLAFLYILFQTVSSSFAISGDMSVFWAVWLPNVVFLLIAIYLYYFKAPR